MNAEWRIKAIVTFTLAPGEATTVKLSEPKHIKQFLDQLHLFSDRVTNGDTLAISILANPIVASEQATMEMYNQFLLEAANFVQRDVVHRRFVGESRGEQAS